MEDGSLESKGTDFGAALTTCQCCQPLMMVFFCLHFHPTTLVLLTSLHFTPLTFSQILSRETKNIFENRKYFKFILKNIFHNKF